MSKQIKISKISLVLFSLVLIFASITIFLLWHNMPIAKKLFADMGVPLPFMTTIFLNYYTTIIVVVVLVVAINTLVVFKNSKYSKIIPIFSLLFIIFILILSRMSVHVPLKALVDHMG